MAINFSSKEVNKTEINCYEDFNIKISVGADAAITDNPVDIALVLDHSTSMNGEKFEKMKIGAKAFVDVIDAATNNGATGTLAGGTKIGIIGFGSSAAQLLSLSTSVADMKKTIDRLIIDGTTNHNDAFLKADNLFVPPSTNPKIIVFFTDGKYNTGGSPDATVDKIKAKGTSIYCLGLSPKSLDEAALKRWASDPDSKYYAVAENPSDVEKMFSDIAKRVTTPGATNVKINEKINPCFEIVGIENVTTGVPTITDGQNLVWDIDQIGGKGTEIASLDFKVRHIGPCDGDVIVNEEIIYRDDEGNKPDFGSPVIKVICPEDVVKEPCPVPVELIAENCKDTVVYDAGIANLESLGRILELNVKIKSVCPGKRVALGVYVTEVDGMGKEYSRGLKTFLVPPHSNASCTDINVECIKFVIPEELDPSGNTNTICNERKFRVRYMVNYVDSDFNCCGNI